MYTLENHIQRRLYLTLVLSLFLCSLQFLQAQQFTPTLYNDENISQYNVSKFISQEEKHCTALKEGKTDKNKIILSLIKLSELNRTRLNYSAAYNYSGEALFLAEELDDAALLSKAHQECGLLNYLFKQDNAAKNNLNSSLAYAKMAFNEGTIKHKELYAPYYNCLLYNQRMDNVGEHVTLHRHL